MAGVPKKDLLKARQFVARTLAERPKEVAGRNGSPSATKMVNLLKAETGIVLTRQALTRWFKEDMSKYLEITNFENNSSIREYDDLMDSAKSIWNNPENKSSDRTKAYNSYLKAKKQREDLLQQLADEKIRQADVERPIYLLSFKPGSAKHKCPNCGKEFYEMDEKAQKEIKDNKTQDNASEPVSDESRDS